MPFYCATENMAALLRSARLLKFSPSGLLQITGTKRNGPPLSRRVWPNAAGCVRNYAVATEQKDDVSVAVRSKQAQEFDWALAKLDSSVRRTGRITKTLLYRIFHDICRKGYPSGNQALLLLRSCGSLLPEVPLAERTEIAHRVWDKLKELGAQYDVSHYNALLKVYIQNEFKFSPTDFLAKMEAANVQPNRVTYQRLIAAYCLNGDIEGASTILGFMKTKDLPITEAVFNSLVTGHACSGDIESAKNILAVMKGAGIEPGPDTYTALLNAYAEKGDLDSMKATLETAANADCSLMDRDLMQVIYTLAKAGHQQHIPELTEHLRQERGFVPDAMNLCLSLITQGLEDSAFHILKTFPVLQSDSLTSDSPNLGNFFLRHCVSMDTSLEKLGIYCKELQESNLHATPLSFTLSCALEANKSVLSFGLMKMMKEQGLPVRIHYFWPLLTHYVKDKDSAGVVAALKCMQELELSPDAETLSNYIFAIYPSIEAARQLFPFLCLSLSSLLGPLCFPVSDPSFPSLDLGLFRGSLILGFRSDKLANEIYSHDNCSLCVSVCLCVCACSHPEKVSYFLYNLIDSMPDKDVQAQEEKLRKYFNQLKKIMISQSIYRGIRNLLESYHVPELIKDVIVLVDPKERGLNDPVTPGIGAKVFALEKKLAELKAENEPIGTVLKQLIQALCFEENLQGALELKQQHEEAMTIGGYAFLLNLCCRHDNVEEAVNLKMEMSRKDSSLVLDANKYMGLVKTLSKHGRIEEAVDILKEMKEKEVLIDDTQVTTMFHILNGLAAKGNIATIQRLQETIFTLGLAKPTTNLCSPLITAYLDSKDLSGALDAVVECCNRYKVLPRIHDIIVALVEEGNTELLQKAMDFVSQNRGEMTMLYDLFFAFLQTGRYREARKIIETPGLRARPGRLYWYAEKCISANKMESLEQMVDMTTKLFECDRDEMYSYILRLCKETNDWKKAEAVWTKMQEENVVPRDRTLRMLADILKNNGQEVPFDMPEVSEQCPQPQRKDTDTFKADSSCKKAFELLKDAKEKGLVFSPSIYDQVIRSLFAEGLMEDAMAVKDIATSNLPAFQLSDIATNLLIVTLSKRGLTQDALEKLRSMLSEDRVPTQLALTRLVQALGSNGNVAGIKEVETLLKDLGININLSSMVFINNIALAHIKNGDVDSAVEVLEELYARPDSTHPSIAFVFRKVLEEENEKAIDKLSVMAERLANHFACYRPATDLFLQLLDIDKVEDAKFMLARCNAVAEQREMLISYMSRKAQNPGQVIIPHRLLLFKSYNFKEIGQTCFLNDLSSAKALYEQMQKEGIAADELSLKRLAVLLRNQGETVPFTEPPVSLTHTRSSTHSAALFTQCQDS
uniref:Leucine rich pentatricopeptide repeat containing n=1 Tax=Sparus aurata TaxID=8175 RepID=A0A671YAB9_SPAAU